MSAFRLGVNYWPARSAMEMWRRFDLGEIRHDFAHIKALGLDFVRFFLLWEDFQPERGRVDERARDRLIALVGAIADAGLTCMPTLFTGHMSGVNWLPEWTLDPARPATRFRTINALGERPYGIGDFYREPLLEAQRWFAAQAGRWLHAHPAMLAWDLGNEFSNLRSPDSIAAGRTWCETLSSALEDASGVPVTGGMHGEDLTEDRNLRPSVMGRSWPFATMHGYPAYSSFARGPADPLVVAFLHDLTRTFSGRDVLFAEFGTPPQHAGDIHGLDETDAAAYCAAAVAVLHARGATGAAWWCYTDYAPELRDRPPFDRAPHEFSFGLVRADGSEKPVARALRAIADARLQIVTQPPVDPALPAESAYYDGLPASLDAAWRGYVAARGSG